MDISRGRFVFFKLLSASILAAALLVMWGRQVTGSPITGDAAQSLQMAINLERHGTLSMEPEAPFVATNYREPLPPILSALTLKLIDSAIGEAPPEAYFAGERAQYVKYQNLLWLALFSLSVFWVTEQFTSSFAAGLIAVVLVNVPFRPPHLPPGPIDTLMTEVPSLWLLVAASATLAIGLERRKLALLALCGALFGALALVKAVALYVVLALVVIIPCLYFFGRQRVPLGSALRDSAVLLGAFACIVGPWMYRNHVQLGSFQITQRAGESLFERSLEDQMSGQECLGAIYLWAPHLQKPLGKWLGFSANDVRRGGRLQRLDNDPDSRLSQEDLAFEKLGEPEKTVTFYRQARAEREKLEHDLEVAGSAHPDVAADEQLKSRALATFVEHPWRHLTLSPLFLWRGAAQTMLILLVVLLCSARLRRADLALLALPSLGMVAAYTLFSPFFPRYGFPMHLMAIVLVVIVCKLLWDAAHRMASRADTTEAACISALSASTTARL
jgi:hypothetical protein